MHDFFSMGGYAFYVWCSYGMSLLVLLVVFIWPLLQRRKLIEQSKRDQQRQEKLARRQH